MEHSSPHCRPSSYLNPLISYILRCTPATIVGGLTGYYSLGMAYELGIMAEIDKIAIRILRPSLGYMGIAAIMPTFQWYSAYGVRIAAGITATLLYSLVERIMIAIYCLCCFQDRKKQADSRPF